MPQLSVVIPVFNEQDTIPPLLTGITTVLGDRFDYELICIDDHSTDDSRAVLMAQKASHPSLRVLHHHCRSGQSTAVWHGVYAARSPWIITLDGDGQNDPVDMIRLLAARDTATPEVRLFAGWRTHRQDSFSRRLSSKIANAVRARLLSDGTPDSACGLKLFERELFLSLPYFDHMHRYLPALVRRAGFESQNVAVGHRARTAGISKYGMFDRLWVGLVDLCGVAWLMRRARVGRVEEI